MTTVTDRTNYTLTETIASGTPTTETVGTRYTETYDTTVTTGTKTTTVTVTPTTTTTPGTEVTLSPGDQTISASGVYRLNAGFTGTLTVTAEDVQFVGDGSTISNVHIVDNGMKNLYLKNIKIKNDSGEEGSIISFSGTDNKLHLIGDENSLNQVIDSSAYILGDSAEDITASDAIINAGGGLTIVGDGGQLNAGFNMDAEDNYCANATGAVIGSDENGTCGNITIDSGVALVLTMRSASIVNPNDGLTYSAGKFDCTGIGAGKRGTCGNITINNDAAVVVSFVSRSSSGAGIGSAAFGTCGDITIYSGAEVESMVADGGAGIGSGLAGNCGNITIYSDTNVHSESESGAGIGGGAARGTCGTVTIYDDTPLLIAVSTEGEDIGKGATGLPNPPSVNVVDYRGSGTTSYARPGTADGSELTPQATTVTSYRIDTTETTTQTATTTTTTSTWDSFVSTRTIAGEVTTNIYDVTDTSVTVITPAGENDAEKKDETQAASLGNPLAIHHGTKANQALHVYINDMHTEAMGLTGISVTTRKNATDALDKIDAALEYALDEATNMGAYLNRLEYTQNNLTTANTSAQASESTIRDADMARAMTDYTKENVLTQAAQSMLAQANQNGSAVLSLLQ